MTLETRTREALPEGGAIRRLWVPEIAAYRSHLLRLDSPGRYSRFAGAVSDEFVSDHARRALLSDGIVHGFFVDGILRGASELRPAGPRYRGLAEVAFSVEAPWQSLGIGTALLERALLAARNRGIHSLRMVCLADNRRMQQLAQKFQAELRFTTGDVIGRVEAARPTPLSVIREILADGLGMAATLLDAQTRLLRAS